MAQGAEGVWRTSFLKLIAKGLGPFGVGYQLIDGVGPLYVARATFDASIAGNQGTGAHVLGAKIPNKYIVVGGVIQVTSAFTSVDSTAQIAISILAANDIQTAAAVSGAPWSTTGLKAIVPKANTPESTGIALTADKSVTATVTVEALTAGKAIILLYCIKGG